MLDYKNMPYASDKPYPLVCVSGKNRNYGRWILDNMGGSNSEMSAVSLYLYNHMWTEPDCVDISYLFHKISIVEMHHLKIFGTLARELGENPCLWTHRQNRMVYWTPGYNQYPTELSRLIHNALAGELATIEKYERQASAVEDVHIVANLERIILDEKIHVQIFKDMITEYNL